MCCDSAAVLLCVLFIYTREEHTWHHLLMESLLSFSELLLQASEAFLCMEEPGSLQKGVAPQPAMSDLLSLPFIFMTPPMVQAELRTSVQRLPILLLNVCESGRTPVKSVGLCLHKISISEIRQSGSLCTKVTGRCHEIN